MIFQTTVMPAPGLFNQGDPDAYGFGYYYKEMIPNNRGAGLFLYEDDELVEAKIYD